MQSQAPTAANAETRRIDKTSSEAAPEPSVSITTVFLTSPASFHRLRRVPWGIIAPLTLFILILLAFLPALMAGFVDWDDDDLLFKLTYYRTLDADSLRWMFTTSYAGHFQPLTWLSYSLDWALWKRNFFGYHLTSVLFHAFTAITVYFLARRLIAVAYRTGESSSDSESRRGYDPALILCSALAAALFAIHPLRAESVAWLSERRDVLSGFFFVAAVASYLHYATVSGRRSFIWYFAAIFLQTLSLLSKATAATLPLVLLILDVYPLRRIAWSHSSERRRTLRVLLEKTPFFLLAILGGLRAWIAQSQAGAMYPLAEYDLLARFAQACYGLAFYIGKTAWPADLGPLYQLPPRDVLFGPMLWASAIVVALMACLAVAVRRRVPAVTAAIAAYVVILTPVLGFFQSGPQLVADRYSYLSCLGFAILAAAGLLAWIRHASLHHSRRKLAALVLSVAAALTALFHATAAQSDIWSSSIQLWARGVAVSPDSSIAHANLADALTALGDLPAAARHYRRALELQPRDPITANHFADVLLRLGDRPRATAMYEWTLRLDPNRAGAYLNLAHLLVAEGRPFDAADLLRGRTQDAPTDIDAARFLADLLSTHPDAAVRNGQEAASLAARVSESRGDHDAPALLIWATALAEAGRYDEGITTARRALGIAEQNRNDRLVYELRRRLGLFEQHKPYHSGD